MSCFSAFCSSSGGKRVGHVRNRCVHFEHEVVHVVSVRVECCRHALLNRRPFRLHYSTRHKRRCKLCNCYVTHNQLNKTRKFQVCPLLKTRKRSHHYAQSILQQILKRGQKIQRGHPVASNNSFL